MTSLNMKNKKKFKINKIDMVIYFLALVSFVLMMVILISTRDDDSDLMAAENEDTLITYNNNPADQIFQSHNISDENITVDQNTNQDNEEVILDIEPQADESEVSSHEQVSINETENNQANEDIIADIADSSSDYGNEGYNSAIESLLTELETLDNAVNRVQEESQPAAVSENTVAQREVRRENQSEERNNNRAAAVVQETESSHSENITSELILFTNNTSSQESQSNDDGNDQQRVSSHTAPSPAPNSVALSTYTIERGDCLWKIAAKYNCSTHDLIRLNNFTNPNLIHPGEVINIPV